MQGKLGHTFILYCLTVSTILPFDDSKLVCMQGKLVHILELPTGVSISFLFHQQALCIQGKLGCTSTLICLMAPSFSLLPQQACMHAFKCLPSLCRGACSACGNGNPSVLGRRERPSLACTCMQTHTCICLLTVLPFEVPRAHAADHTCH